MAHDTATKARTNGGFGRGRPKFTPEQRQEILARSDAGESAPALARRFGCTSAAIYYHLRTTLRHIPLKELRAEAAARPRGSAACIRCGIDLGRPGMCQDCLDVEAVTQ